MKLIDFVMQIAEATDHSVDVIVNGVKVYVSGTGLIFSEKLYMLVSITRLEYKSEGLYIAADLEKTPISEAVLSGKRYAGGMILLYAGTLYLVDGFEIGKLFSRDELKEMLNL